MREGDHRLIEAALTTGGDVDAWHGLGLTLLDVFRENRMADCATTMLFIYEQSPCSTCRAGAVELLIEQGMLPDELREECALDANQDLRELVGPDPVESST